jgi:alpha-tubulin suppressor-like RCC1 family protein
VAAVAGSEHTLLLTADGAVYAMGTDYFGQCGQGRSAGAFVKTPVRVRGALDRMRVVAVAAGEYHSLALGADGAVYGFGANRQGALGHGDLTDVGLPRPMSGLPPGAAAVAVAGGGGHSLVLLDDGSLLAVGRGRSGQLGRGDALESVAAYRTMPLPVTGLPDGTLGALSIAAGRDHSLAVVAVR